MSDLTWRGVGVCTLAICGCSPIPAYWIADAVAHVDLITGVYGEPLDDSPDRFRGLVGYPAQSSELIFEFSNAATMDPHYVPRLIDVQLNSAYLDGYSVPSLFVWVWQESVISDQDCLPYWQEGAMQFDFVLDEDGGALTGNFSMNGNLLQMDAEPACLNNFQLEMSFQNIAEFSYWQPDYVQDD